MFPSFASRALVAGAAFSLLTAGCGGDDTSAAGAADTAAASAGTAGTVAVLAAFYPLEFAAARVGGDRVEVSNLTAPGAEPHDLELSPRDVGRISDADLVLVLGGFQPAVDDAVSGEAADVAFDVADAAGLDLAGVGEESGGTDPHFWLDPLRLADVADATADRLAEVDPGSEEEYSANAAVLRAELEALDAELEAGLTGCATTSLVTSHTAFGYLADRYSFEQVGLTGLSPEDEPSAADLAALTDLVTARGVRTVYSETLVSPVLAETVAAETGAVTAVLDPLEGLGPDAAGDDYLEVMRANLATLRVGQSCP